MNPERTAESGAGALDATSPLPVRPASAKSALVATLLFAVTGAGWFFLADWILAAEWVKGTVPGWLARAGPALGVVVAGSVVFYIVLRRFTERQRSLVRQVRAAEEMLLSSQKLEALGVLAASMAHDFNNTLTVIRGMSDLARMESYDPKVSKSAMEAIQLATFRAEEIARQLIVFLSEPADRFSMRDLNALARDFASIVRQAAGARTFVAYELEEGLPPVRMNRGMIEQALLNLVMNARDALADTDSARITISTRTVRLSNHTSAVSPAPVSGAFVEFAVSDNGSGIPAGDLARAFAPFFTTKRHGTGLGLPSVLRAVQHHDGFVDVISTPGTGTSVRLLLPLTQPPHFTEVPPEASPFSSASG